ncbi:PLP-dependent aminotransferase family protein [Paenibacillus sp. V4I5]|uniref:MocR-like pyridoxine biosynthesis transcription factor PdxR n=1 Tax=Paenibacillus sp. V4I5 TaxID=3042306 RepID=UPI0027937DA8|nr:PLP-dependent aminotransferase family protein [Paenibacillus sp. V4I5]MDQ0916331.1 GntR family transcriptional regulator/MocR family aminotransferase [Paenibacillus sp. V4I5]
MFGFNPTAGVGSITKQLCAYLRENIENGALAPGLQLPPTRKAAQELGIARNIVIEVYEQLTAEGYLFTHIGSGTYIAEDIQTSPVRLPPPPPVPQSSPPDLGMKENEYIDFDAGTPDLRHFPRRLWSKYVREIMENGQDFVFDYGDVQGNKVFREAIARYVYRVKGIRCSEDQIIITSGTSDGALLLASSFSALFRTVYVEEPTIGFIADIFQRLSYEIYPVPVDSQGMVINEIPNSDTSGLIILTPSHQYPTGSILSIQRRRQVVKLAEATRHYIVEDDYNSEFRHKGSPIPPLQILAPSRVIYAGTFSKTLSPALRIGFLIVPPALIDQVVQTRIDLNLSTSGITQAALARFMEDGHLDRHIHKMKGIYKKRRIFLTEQCQRLFNDGAQILGDEAGMHVQIAFRPELYGKIDWHQIDAYGVRLSSFDDYARNKGRHPGKIVLGYGKLKEEEIGEGLRRIHSFIEKHKL